MATLVLLPFLWTTVICAFFQSDGIWCLLIYSLNIWRWRSLARILRRDDDSAGASVNDSDSFIEFFGNKVKGVHDAPPATSTRRAGTTFSDFLVCSEDDTLSYHHLRSHARSIPSRQIFWRNRSTFFYRTWRPWSMRRLARTFASISESGHHHAAAEEAVAGRQRAQELPTSVQPLVSFKGHRESCCWAVRQVLTRERPAITFAYRCHHSTLSTETITVRLVIYLRRYWPPGCHTARSFRPDGRIQLRWPWYSLRSTPAVLWQLRCGIDMDTVVPSWTDSASLLRWSSFDVDVADIWRITRLTTGPVAIFAVHRRVIWRHRQCWFNCTFIRQWYLGVHQRSSNILINHCATLHLVHWAYWCLDEQQPAEDECW